MKTSLLVIIIISYSTAFAMDTGTDAGKSKKHGKEQSQSIRKSRDQGDSMEIRLSTDSVFSGIIAELESAGKLGRCEIITHPKLPADFGLSSQIDEYTIDAVKAQYIEQQAKNNAVAPSGIKLYKNCMAFESAVIAQAHIYLMEMLGQAMDIEAIKSLAELSVEKVLHVGIDDDNINAIYQSIKADKIPCRFNQSLHSFRCGATSLDLTSQKMTFGGIEIYGNKFYGYSGDYKVSASSKQTRELVLLQRRNWENSKSTKQAISLANLLPKVD